MSRVYCVAASVKRITRADALQEFGLWYAEMRLTEEWVVGEVLLQ